MLIDTNQECYKSGGWQEYAALGLGLPSLILFVCACPASLFVRSLIAGSSDRKVFRAVTA